MDLSGHYFMHGEDKCNQPFCSLCERYVPEVTRHHLIPVKLHKNKWFQKRYTREEMQQTIPLCRECHKTLHRFIDHKSMGRIYNTREALLQHPKVSRFVLWIKKRG